MDSVLSSSSERRPLTSSSSSAATDDDSVSREMWTHLPSGETFVYPLSRYLEPGPSGGGAPPHLVMFRVNSRCSVAPFLEFALQRCDDGALDWPPAQLPDGDKYFVGDLEQHHQQQPSGGEEEEEEDGSSSVAAAIALRRATDAVYLWMKAEPGTSRQAPRFCGAWRGPEREYCWFQVDPPSPASSSPPSLVWVTVHDLVKARSVRGEPLLRLLTADFDSQPLLWCICSDGDQVPAEIPISLEPLAFKMATTTTTTTTPAAAADDDDDDDDEKVWYMFQPVHITDRGATVFERSHPAVDRPTVVQFTRPETLGIATAITTSAAAAAVAAASDTQQRQQLQTEEADQGETAQAVEYRAKLCPHMLTFQLAKVFGDERGDAAAARHIPADVRDAAAAAVGRLVPNEWYSLMKTFFHFIHREVDDISGTDDDNDLTAAAAAELPPSFLVWVVAQYFLDSRTAMERAYMLRHLLNADPAFLATADDVASWRRAALPTWDASVGWAARAAFCLKKYMAERMYFSGPEDGFTRVAVFVDMTTIEITKDKITKVVQKLPKLCAVMVDVATAEPVRLRTLADPGDWVKPAAQQRNRRPADVAQRVVDAREAKRTWPMVAPSLAAKKYQPGGWHAAMMVRVNQALTDTRPNASGGRDIDTLMANDAKMHWRNVTLNYADVGELRGLAAVGEQMLEPKRTPIPAKTVFALLMQAAAQLHGCHSYTIGEAFVLNDLL